MSRAQLSRFELGTLVAMVQGCESAEDYADVVDLFAQLEPSHKPQLKSALVEHLPPDKLRRLKDAAIALAAGEAQ